MDIIMNLAMLGVQPCLKIKKGELKLRTIEKLVKAEYNMKLGNHRVEIDGNVRRFIYFATNIFEVHDDIKVYTIYRGVNNKYNTPSTNKTINAYEGHFVGLGYEEGQRQVVYKCKSIIIY